MRFRTSDVYRVGFKSLPALMTVIGLSILLSSILAVAWADNFNPGVFSLDSKPYGMTYAAWTAKWEQWLISMPQQVNAAADATGKNCGLSQNGPVWFLAGTTGGSAQRTCTVPAGKAILFPIINSECDFFGFPNVKNVSDLFPCARADNDRSTNLQTTLDGLKLQHLEKYRISSDPFSVTFPGNNLFGVKPGTTTMVVDGFYVFLQPLSAGRHELHFSGLTPGNPTTGTANFATDATYHLIVQ